MVEEEVARYIEMHHILLCGDFNSRTGQAPDYESGVIDINANVPSERSNEYIVSNKYGHLLLKFCINTGFKITNGRMFNNNVIGRYTYYSPNGSSTIDYPIFNENNLKNKFEALPKLVESDHCPIKFNISNTKLDCNPLKRNEQACHAFEEMLCVATEGCNTDTLCDIFNGMLENVTSPLFPTRKHTSKEKKYTQNNFHSKPLV